MGSNDSLTKRREDFSEWLRSEIDRRGWSVAEFARRAQTVRQTAATWTGGTRLPDPESCANIAMALGWHSDAVLGIAGHRPMTEPLSRYILAQRIGEVKDTISGLEDVERDSEPEVPVIGIVPADTVRWTAFGQEGRMARVSQELLDRHGSLLKAVQVSGDCLVRRGIIHGDTVIIVLVTSAAAVKDGQIVVVRIGDDHTMKVWYRTGDYIELRDGDGAVIHRLSIMDDFDVIGVAVHRGGPLG